MAEARERFPLDKFHRNLQLDLINDLDENDEKLSDFNLLINNTYRLFDEKDETIKPFMIVLKRLYRMGDTPELNHKFRQIVKEDTPPLDNADYELRLKCIVVAMEFIVSQYYGMSIINDPDNCKIETYYWEKEK